VSLDKFYLLTPNGDKHEPGESLDEAALRASVLLFTYDWVEIRHHTKRGKTRWTCIDRKDDGAPYRLFVEENNGSMNIVDLTVVKREA